MSPAEATELPKVSPVAAPTGLMRLRFEKARAGPAATSSTSAKAAVRAGDQREDRGMKKSSGPLPGPVHGAWGGADNRMNRGHVWPEERPLRSADHDLEPRQL